MKSIVSIMSVCAAALVMSQPVSAQQPTERRGQQRPQSGTQQTNHVRLSKLIGAKVTSEDGKDVGKIQDIVLNPQTREVQFAIVKQDGILEKEKLNPVPWQALTLQPDGRNYTVKLSQQKMQSAPSFTQDQFSQLDSPVYVIEVYEFYTVEPPEGVGAPGQTQGQQRGTQQQRNPQP